MRSISRRIRRLEAERFGTAADIEFGRRLHERIEEAQRILAELREPGELGPPVCPHVEAFRRVHLEGAAKAKMASREIDTDDGAPDLASQEPQSVQGQPALRVGRGTA